MQGLNPTVVLIFFLATAPIALMPSIIAAATRRGSAPWIVAANLVLWGTLYWGATRFTIETSTSFRIPTFLALLGWLALLGLSIRGPSTKPPRPPP